VPDHTQAFYKAFLAHYQFDYEIKDFPSDYQGKYKRVIINDKILDVPFLLGNHFMIIRNPDEIRFDIVFYKHEYRIKCKDNVHGSRVGLYQAESGNRYMFFDGNLYRRSLDNHE
jgi:hypothetical protein